MLYAELHCRSYFSFLAGASSPADLVARAAELGYQRLCITDVDGVHGAVQAHLAGKELGVPIGVGSEVTIVDDLAPLSPTARLGTPGVGARLVLLAASERGYANLCRLITVGRTRCDKGSAWVSWDEVRDRADGLIALSGGRGGPIDGAWRAGKLHDAVEWAGRLRDAFSERAFIELSHHLAPGDDQRLRDLAQLAEGAGLGAVFTQDARFADPSVRRLADVQTCVQGKTTLSAAGSLLGVNAERYLHPIADLERRFGRVAGHAIARAVEVAASLDFSLGALRYRFPSFDLPGAPSALDDRARACRCKQGKARRGNWVSPNDRGATQPCAADARSGDRSQGVRCSSETPFSYLHRLTGDGARARYRPITPRAAAQIAHELSVIEKLDLAGYFLIVWDIVRFCRERGILCQGRGSAANSAVCYALGITAIDPVSMDLLFERFLSEDRDEMPDIDLDIANDRREEVLQYVYRRFGRERVAMACNVNTYHARSAIRDVGKVFGLSLAQVDRAAKAMEHHALDPSPQGAPTARYDGVPSFANLDARTKSAWRAETGLDLDDPLVAQVFDIARAFESLPRHLGIHSGGVVITAGPVSEVVPVENASMAQRTVVQWDKDDLAAVGIIKIDLLGLGMLSAIDDAVEHVRRAEGVDLDLAHLPKDDPAVFDMICKADTVGVFQIESRAQMSMLPRLRPRTFYDLVIEVAIIRPGPIQGDMVHPYLRRRYGDEPVTFEHPALEPVLARTLGVPLFQEQGMKLAITCAGFTPTQADELRRAMGHKRSHKRMAALEKRLRDGMTDNGISAELAERIYSQLCAFADYGFPESHSASFALIVYASCYLKKYHPEAFLAGLLNAQPMGFYSANSLIADARRHGVEVAAPCARRSEWRTCLEARGDARPAVRLGMKELIGLATKHRETFERERARAPFASLTDFARRSGLPRTVLTNLAAVGGFACYGLDRRDAVWKVAALPPSFGHAPLLDRIEGEELDAEAPAGLAPMTAREELLADFRGLGSSVAQHPVDLLRARLQSAGAATTTELGRQARHGQRIAVGGMVTTRQRPGSARGMLFMTLEDEVGIANLVLTPPVYQANRRVARSALFVLARGVVERQSDVVNLRVESLEEIPAAALDDRMPGLVPRNFR